MLLVSLVVVALQLLLSPVSAFSASAVRINNLLCDTSSAVASSPSRAVTFIEHTIPLTFSWVVHPHTEEEQQSEEEYGHTVLPTPRAVRQTSYTISLHQVTPVLVSSSSSSSSSLFKWSSGMVPSSSHVHILYDGPALQPDTTYEWSIEYCINANDACSKPTTGLLHTTIQDWHNASFIGHSSSPLTQYRRTFSIDSTKSIHEATLYLATLGISEVEINGKNIDSTRKLDPVWSTYELRSYYSAFAVTSYLVQNSSSSASSHSSCMESEDEDSTASALNIIGIWLGSGWFSQEQYMMSSKLDYNYTNPRFQMYLSIVYTDGTMDTLISESASGKWVGRVGPILHDSIYNGEHFDARLHDALWTVPSHVMHQQACEGDGEHSSSHSHHKRSGDGILFNWVPAETLGLIAPNTVLTLQAMPPIRASDDGVIIKPIALIKSDKNCYIFDMGQNFAGWARIKLRGPRGLQVTIKYAEVMELKQGKYGTQVYTDNLRAALATDTYIMNGPYHPLTTYELYEPRFTYHGFRYVQVMGNFFYMSLEDVEGVIVRSWTKQTSALVFNHSLLNQIQHAVIWGSQSNMMGIMTDCPQRDERKGWMGDAGLSVDEVMFNFDSSTFYQTFAQQIRDVQLALGAVTDTVPYTFGFRPADANWGHAYPAIVSSHYSHFGDVSFVQTHYAGVRDWVQFLYSQYTQKLLPGLKNFYYRYGDWVPPKPETATNPSLVSSYAFLSDVQIMVSLATVINNTADATYYSNLYAKLATEFHTTFYNETTGSYADGKQSAQALALVLPNVVPPELRASVAQALVTDIQRHGNHFTTGITGITALYPSLASSNYSSVALDLLLQTSYPSYGYMFNNPFENATTFWEVFDAPNEPGGMNSRNHHMLASVGSFLHRNLAGIQIDHFATLQLPSSTAVRIEPMWSDARLNYVKDELDTMYGRYFVEWRRSLASDEEGEWDIVNTVISVSVPTNAAASLILPSPHAERRLRCQSLSVADFVRVPVRAGYHHHGQQQDGYQMKAMNEVVLFETREDGSSWVMADIHVNVNGIESMMYDEEEGSVVFKLASGNFQFTALWA